MASAAVMRCAMYRALCALFLLSSCGSEVGGLTGGLQPLADEPEPPAPAPLCAGVAGELPANEAAPLQLGHSVVGVRPECTAVGHAFAGAGGMTVDVTLTAWNAPEGAIITVESLAGEVLAGPAELKAGESVALRLPQTGEQLLYLAPSDRNAATNTYEVRVDCTERCSREYSRYPIVLVHGAAPGNYFDLVDYFYGVRDYVSQSGFLVLTPVLDPWRPTQERALQLAAALDSYAAAGLGRRFNLIGHSQGGLDSRYVASQLDPQGRIASVTTIASPHHGTQVADVVTGLVGLSPIDGVVFDALADALAWMLGEGDQDAVGTAAFMTTLAMQEFNAEVPDADGVAYASWSGHSCGPLDSDCQDAHNGEVVAPYLLPTYLLLKYMAGPNDGMVSVDSSMWGDYLGELPADHMDEVGQIIDMSPGPFDHKAFFLSEARRLAAAGY